MADAASCRRIFLVRHGETLYGGTREGALPGSDLTEEGYRQIEALATLLAGVALDAIYASPLGRAQATARTLTRPSGLPIVTVEALREITPGDVAHLEMAQIFGAVQAFFAGPDTDWDTPYLGGETYRALRDRAWAFVADLLRRADWRRIAIVAHGGFNNAVIGQVIGSAGSRLANVEQDFGCVNIIDVVGDRPILRLLNFTAYDPLKAAMESPSMEILRAVLASAFPLDDPDSS